MNADWNGNPFGMVQEWPSGGYGIVGDLWAGHSLPGAPANERPAYREDPL
jgi:hypothetical protein